jgi:lipopolysaccharide export system protein LptA
VKIAGQQGRYAVGHDRLVLVGEVIVERNAVEIKGGKEVTVYETWPIICQTVH